MAGVGEGCVVLAVVADVEACTKAQINVIQADWIKGQTERRNTELIKVEFLCFFLCLWHSIVVVYHLVKEFQVEAREAEAEFCTKTTVEDCCYISRVSVVRENVMVVYCSTNCYKEIFCTALEEDIEEPVLIPVEAYVVHTIFNDVDYTKGNTIALFCDVYDTNLDTGNFLSKVEESRNLYTVNLLANIEQSRNLNTVYILCSIKESGNLSTIYIARGIKETCYLSSVYLAGNIKETRKLEAIHII